MSEPLENLIFEYGRSVQRICNAYEKNPAKAQ